MNAPRGLCVSFPGEPDAPLTRSRFAARLSRPPEGESSAGGRRQRRDPREDEVRAWAEGLGEPAGERAADRGRAQEDDPVERHDTAAHRRLDLELELGVDAG